MTKYIKRLLFLLIIFAATATHAPPAHAEGGLVFKPYWTFRTDAPVTHVKTGDIDGDGAPEIVAAAGNIIYVLENDGTLAWRYEKEDVVRDLVVDNLDSDGQTDEIYAGGASHDVILSDTERPVWMYEYVAANPTMTAVAADIDGDGRREIFYVNENPAEPRLATVRWVEDTYVRKHILQPTPSVDLWVGDVDGDEKLEIVPSPASGSQIIVFDVNGDRVWQNDIDGEVGLVQVGDVDGDGQAEVAVLSTTWEMFLLDSKGRQIWHQQAISVGNVADKPERGQFLLHDLDGDGRLEIVVIAPTPATAVHVFDGQGRQVWEHSLEDISSSARLIAGDIDGDGAAEVVIATEGQQQVYLLNGGGQRLGEYHLPSLVTFAGPLSPKTTGAVAYADLDGDGGGEIIVGSEAGVTVFGASHQVVHNEQWQSSRLGLTVSNLYLDDLDNDGRGEVVIASEEGWLYILDNDGQIQAQVDLEVALFALGTGDVDGDGQRELAIATTSTRGKVHLLDGEQPRWTAQMRGTITGLIGDDLNGDNRAEFIVGGSLPDGWVRLLNSQGEELWQVEFDDPVTAVGSDGGEVLAGTESGQLYRLTAEGVPVGDVDLGAEILSINQGLAVTAKGQVYRLADGEPTLAYEVGEEPDRIQVGLVSAMTYKNENKVSLVSGDGLVWQGEADGTAGSLATGDLNGDGSIEIAVGTDGGQVHLFGLTLDQPPLLTQPDLAETRNGYEYSVEVTDPEGDAVPVTLEIWDPSANTWQPQAAQSLDEGQDRGELIWDISEPFDIWDSGQESRFHFVYEFGGQQTISAEIPGPFNIPTTPWYLYYGQRVGLGALILLVPALGLVLYRRQRTYRRSPAGQAETLLKQLQAQPDEILTHLHTLTNENPALLPYLSGAARQAGETAIADLSEGHNLLLVRPEVTAEDLRVVIDAIRRLDGPSAEKKTKIINIFDLFQQALEANTVNRIVSLSVRLHEQLTEVEVKIGEALNDLTEVVKTLNNFQRVAAFEDKTAYLGQALEALGRLEREFRTGNMWQPEGNILARIAANWLLAVNNALQDLQGRAQIEATLKTRHLLNLHQATLSLELTNTGRSPASNVTISLIPDQKFAVGNGTAHLDVLAAGRSAVVELPISAAASVEQFRAEFNITFDDRERSGKRLAFADRVQLLRPTSKFQTMPNPYAPGTPLAPGSPIFFGRDDLFEFVTQNIAGMTRQNILVLIGQRRMGKTSFLQQLPARLGEKYLPVYLDGQSLGIDPGMAHFFYDLALAIVDALDDQGIEIREPEPEDFEERPSGAFERSFLPLVFEAIGERQLLLLFDEFEELEMRVTSGKLEATIFPFLRHLMQHNRKLGFIFVGTHRLEALSTDYWSIFFNIALYKHVVFLSEAAARALITEPVAKHGLVYDDLALDKMLRVTAGHPYFLQLTCHALVNHANRVQRGYLTIQDVNSVLDEMVELGEAHFAFLWEQSNPSEQLVLSALTRLLGREPTVTATQVVELLAERGIIREVQNVTETLRQLVERDVIREIAGQPPRYEYKVELVRLWIERYKALGRIVEEVG